MAEAPVLGGASRSVELNADAFGARFNGPLVHESVRAEFAARRRGSASTKTRGLVRGGGAKPWRQKGTGRARAGSSRSPVWTGGGTVFGPHPRSYTFKVNRKERRAACRPGLTRRPRCRQPRRAIDPGRGPAARRLGPAARNPCRRDCRGARRSTLIPQHRSRVRPRAEQRRRRRHRRRRIAPVFRYGIGGADRSGCGGCGGRG